MAQEYSRAIARVIVAQMAKGAGFERMQVRNNFVLRTRGLWQHPTKDELLHHPIGVRIKLYFFMIKLMCSQTSAHEALADLLMRFVTELGTTSHSYAELACRTSANLSDVVGSQSRPFLHIVCMLLLKSCRMKSASMMCFFCAQLLAFEDMGVRMEDLMQYANAEVRA